MQNTLKQFFQIILKNHCLLCELNCHDLLICKSCVETLPVYLNNTPAPLPKHVDQLFSLFDYTAPISHFIWRLKFHGDLSIARWFAHTWIVYLKSVASLPDLILPVPLHYSRLKQRGFNQALEIAKPIGNYFHIPVDTRT